jgi:hypothetical protein
MGRPSIVTKDLNGPSIAITALPLKNWKDKHPHKSSRRHHKSSVGTNCFLAVKAVGVSSLVLKALGKTLLVKLLGDQHHH